jgi:hypothetical protein
MEEMRNTHTILARESKRKKLFTTSYADGTLILILLSNIGNTFQWRVLGKAGLITAFP